MRLTRAAYRFQLLCQLGKPSGDGWHEEQLENIQYFFSLIEPWEVEEMYTFYVFAQSVYHQAITDVTWDLHQDNPKFDTTSDGAFDLSDSKSVIINQAAHF